MTTEYKLVCEKDSTKFSDMVGKLLSNGWQFMTQELIITKNGEFCRELILDTEERPDIETEAKIDPDEFEKRWLSIDQSVQDLLYVNNVYVAATESGSLITGAGDTVEPGIIPSRVLELVMKGGHVPINLDKEKFIEEIEKLIA